MIPLLAQAAEVATPFIDTVLTNADKIGAVGILAALILWVKPRLDRYRIDKNIELRKLEIESAERRSKREADRAFRMSALITDAMGGAPRRPIRMEPDEDDDLADTPIRVSGDS